MFHTIVSIKNDGHYFCRAGGNRPDGLNEPVTKVLKKHIQNMMLSVYHTLFQHYALMFLQELQFTGGKRCFCSYLALRDSVGQILPPLQS
ncbi:hypothetical protein F1748_20345 [Escherichia coli]|nr:hypothetical protein F1748_20345 [Escherichia coli]